MDSCDCCGSTKDVGQYNSTLSHSVTIDLCARCHEAKHEPKWLLDEIIEEAGGLEFCKPWIRSTMSKARYCVVRDREEET